MENLKIKDGKVLVGYTGSAAAGVVGTLKIWDLKKKLKKLKNKKKARQLKAEIERINKKIERIPRLNDRIIEIVRFERYKENDVKNIIEQLSDYRFETNAIEKITKMSDGRIRPIIRLIHAAEVAARIHQLKTIEGKDF